MSTPTQFDRDLIRILLYRDNATELLIETTPEDRLRLPAVPVPPHTRVVKEVHEAIKSSWNLETYCLFPLSNRGSPDAAAQYQVLELSRPEAKSPMGMRWIPVVSLPVGAFEKDSTDFGAIQNSLATLREYRRNQIPGPFGRPGWLQTVRKWVEVQAARVGLSLTGEFQQFNACPTFSLIRFETDGSALWFKAVGEPHLNEYRTTLKLASEFEDFVPRIVASKLEWNAWLSLESKGYRLDANSPLRAWAAAAENLALLQISSFGRTFQLLGVGCKDLRPCELLELVDPFFNAMTELMRRQTKRSPAPLSRQELLTLGRDITVKLKDLSQCAIPSTLGHLDLNPGNILVYRTHCVFLDWAEAYVGPPFFSFQYLLEHFRRLLVSASHDQTLLQSAYARHWTRFASPDEIAAAFRVAPLLGAFTYAVGCGSWRNPENIGQETSRYLRSLTRRMKREMDTLNERRSLCLS